VFVGGALGTLLRAGLAELLPAPPGSWPWGTLIANLAGAAILAALVARRTTAPLLGAGFCGALTTFSGFVLEIEQMLAVGDVALAVAYAGVSLGAGFGLVTAIVRHRA
jgi:fluoride exporter